MDKIIVGEFPRNAQEIVRVSLGTYRDKTYCDVRIFFIDSDGHAAPTKKGVTIPIECIGALINVLSGVENAAPK